eukprot:CAMPEP_0119429484 /NCGR_PEP_ID=MMETSP1335-20130426/42291_1 /TAXON_ID=259385 /ORGANISM="Chrysoculter rhomboideus, Strain RCC1486" /LENGTH=236 /DNA_ID=CAMNT_0007455205 /DNA_START=36 /DNA_END=746 /DNA_ORIENTATION=-
MRDATDDVATVRALFDSAKIDLAALAPAADRKKSGPELLAAAGLVWLNPAAGCENAVATALSSGADDSAVVASLKPFRDDGGLKPTELGTVLMRAVLDHWEAEVGATAVAGDGALKSHGKKLVSRLGLVKRVAGGDAEVQTEALVQTQLGALRAVHAFALRHSFPHDLIKTLFIALYNADVVSEEGLQAWREDDAETVPEKGKALMKVNQFFQELEAQDDDEEEEGEEDDDDDEEG